MFVDTYTTREDYFPSRSASHERK